jgi:hypothetical protein
LDNRRDPGNVLLNRGAGNGTNKEYEANLPWMIGLRLLIHLLLYLLRMLLDVVLLRLHLVLLVVKVLLLPQLELVLKLLLLLHLEIVLLLELLAVLVEELLLVVQAALGTRGRGHGLVRGSHLVFVD